MNAWFAVLRHAFWAHWQVGRSRVRRPKILYIPQIITEQWIKLDVHAKARPIDGVDELVVRAVNDVDFPAHQVHL